MITFSRDLSNVLGLTDVLDLTDVLHLVLRPSHKDLRGKSKSYRKILVLVFFFPEYSSPPPENVDRKRVA